MSNPFDLNQRTKAARRYCYQKNGALMMKIKDVMTSPVVVAPVDMILNRQSATSDTGARFCSGSMGKP
jgi:hypothetical protein